MIAVPFHTPVTIVPVTVIAVPSSANVWLIQALPFHWSNSFTAMDVMVVSVNPVIVAALPGRFPTVTLLLVLESDTSKICKISSEAALERS